MKTTALVLAALALAAGPALAGAAKKPHWSRAQARCLPSVHDQECSPAQRYDRLNVYSYDGRLIGRDPDPNIRMQLRDDDLWLRRF
jgi:hypothetical protein